MATAAETQPRTSNGAIPRLPAQGSERPTDHIPGQEKQDVEAGITTSAQGKPATPEAAAASAPYTVFTRSQRAWIALLASTAAMVSPMSSYIYYPALVAVADMRFSVTLVNLTITSYLIVAGISPAIMGDLADRGGRKLAYVAMWTLYIATNVGIAVWETYPALLVLRMLQSAGSSGQCLACRPGFPETRRNVVGNGCRLARRLLVHLPPPSSTQVRHFVSPTWKSHQSPTPQFSP